MSTQDETGAETAITNQEDASEEAIRQRAYEISQASDAGTPAENWERAKRELNAEH